MTFQFKIQLRDIDNPKVWRQVLVPAHFTFYTFHLVIQQAFGWENYHMFQFSPKGYASSPEIGIPNPGMDVEVQDAKKVKVKDIFTKAKQKFTYIYDFGDDWMHDLLLEKITDENLLKAACIAGEGHCPPEDCGGPWGYEELKEVLNNPDHPEHAERKEWLGLKKNQKWDAVAFDLKKTNLQVQKV
jgi:hypothetical protein